MSGAGTAQFGRWRSFFWPIHRWELKKFFPMLGIFSLISFNYNILRAYKDSLVVTAPHSGAEALPFIKVWAILPSAILFTFLFTRLMNRFTREQVFYIMMGIFLAFFFLFTFILLPFQEMLHPHGLADALQQMLPTGFKGFIAIFRNWTFTLFYVMSELWGSAIMTVLFWGFANEVTTLDEAKRYYSLLMIGANVGGICAGHASILFAETPFIPSLPYGCDSWEQSMLFLNCTIIVLGLVTMALFRWLNTRVVLPQERQDQRDRPQDKVKMSMRKNFSYLMRSKYLVYIAILVISYNLTMNLVEVVWKNQMKQVYPNPTDYSSYMGQMMIWMEVIAMVSSLLITGNVIRRFSWAVSASVAPIIMGCMGLIFFFFSLLSPAYFPACLSFLGPTPLFISLTFGSIHNCLTRASKYTFFDSTKEIAFIPLSSESRLKGKAAIDGVASRLGKSGSSFIHQGFLLLFATVGASIPYVAVVFIVVLVIWMIAIQALGKQFNLLAEAQGEEELLETSSTAPTLTKELA